jgi:hypothetical protein
MYSQDCVLGAEMDATLNLPADSNSAPYGLATSSTPSSPAQSSQSSAASGGKMEKFLLLEALLSFLHSAVSSVYIIWFHVHVSLYYMYTLRRIGRMRKLAILTKCLVCVWLLALVSTIRVLSSQV